MPQQRMTRDRPDPASARDDSVDLRVRMTSKQMREINRRAGLGLWDGRARTEFMIGCALGEPQGSLLERVHAIRDQELARLRAELDADRAAREQRERERART